MISRVISYFADAVLTYRAKRKATTIKGADVKTFNERDETKKVTK